MPKIASKATHPSSEFHRVRRERTVMVLDAESSARLDRYASERGVGRGEAVRLLLSDVDSLRIRLRAEMSLRHEELLTRMPERARAMYEKERGRPDFKDLV